MGKLTPEADRPALDAVTELAREAVRPPTPEQIERGLRSLRARLAAADVRGRTRRQLWLGTAVVLALVAGLWAAPGLRSRWSGAQPAVALDRIEGGSLLDGGYLSESGHTGIRLFFNEGSSFALTPGARGRLRELSRDGARFGLEEGAASFQITPNAARRWSVEAGPFLVTVKGTVFKVSWDPASERFELVLRRGHVVVDGPVAGGGIPLRAGQRLVIVLRSAQILISEDAAADESAAAPAPATPPPPAASSPRRAATRAVAIASGPPAPGRASEPRRWSELLAAGRWDEILAEADRDGTDAVLKTAGSEDLLALADAARYRRRIELARAALLAQRRRFPGSPRALDALFLLGRVEELSAGGAARALAVYDDYLARAPQGAYAAEALGRKMLAVERISGRDAARGVAAEYVNRFPNGTYMLQAHAILANPSP